MKYVSLYESAPDVAVKAPIYFADHRARIAEFHGRGVLLMVGTLGNPPEGAMGVFTSREAAEEFVIGDSFVLNGVVASWQIKEWNEILAGP
jgi:uncharacterized protein YciI